MIDVKFNLILWIICKKKQMMKSWKEWLNNGKKNMIYKLSNQIL